MDRSTPGRASETPADVETGLDDSQRRVVRLCLIGLAVLGTGSMIGAMSVLYLANHFPLLLIALSPTGRHLILVVPTVHPAAFVAVATLRRLAFYVPCFILGRTLGSTALAWLETRFRGAARFVQWLDRIFQRAQYPAVFFLPGPIMSTIAGNAQMPVATWILLIACGLQGWARKIAGSNRLPRLRHDLGLRPDLQPDSDLLRSSLHDHGVVIVSLDGLPNLEKPLGDQRLPRRQLRTDRSRDHRSRPRGG